jgi:hypothetical protein
MKEKFLAAFSELLFMLMQYTWWFESLAKTWDYNPHELTRTITSQELTDVDCTASEHSAFGSELQLKI